MAKKNIIETLDFIERRTGIRGQLARHGSKHPIYRFELPDGRSLEVPISGSPYSQRQRMAAVCQLKRAMGLS